MTAMSRRVEQALDIATGMPPGDYCIAAQPGLLDAEALRVATAHGYEVIESAVCPPGIFYVMRTVDAMSARVLEATL